MRQALAGEDDLASVAIAVSDSEVTLTGRVPTFWAKSQAIEKALAVDEVETVVSDLEIPKVEDDGVIAQDVVQAIVNYPYYTIFDYVHGGVSQGTVMLAGSVTPELDKASDLFERVAKIRGVQDVQSTIETLPVSGGDGNLRRVLAAKIFDNDFFTKYARLRVPPFHVIVRRGTVTLRGLVRDETEKRLMEQVVRRTSGVIHAVNELETER